MRFYSTCCHCSHKLNLKDCDKRHASSKIFMTQLSALVWIVCGLIVMADMRRTYMPLGAAGVPQRKNLGLWSL